jgi:hypothetical protein
MLRPVRRLLIALGGLIALAAISDTAAWFWLTRRIEAGADDWMAALRAEGWTIDAGSMQRGGWPFAAEIILPDVTVASGGPGGANGVSWSVPRVRLQLSPVRPRTLLAVFEGSQRVRIGTSPPVALDAARMTAAVSMVDSSEPVVLTAVALRAEAAGQMAELARMTARILPNAIDLQAAGIDLPHGIQWPFAAAVSAAAVTVRLEGVVPAAADLPRRIAGWRDGGGRLVIQQASARWGALDAAGSGTFTLDGALQPRAEGVADIANYPGAIAALTQSGALRPNDARVASTLLGLLARTPAGGQPEVNLPFTVRDGLLSVGNFPVARIPALAWGSAPGG